MIDHLTYKPVDKDNWNDLEALFEARGGPSYCWCMPWRMTKEELKQNTSANRKGFIKKRVDSETPIGILAYDGAEPIAWCSVAPRHTHQRLRGDESLENVWSITCFFIQRDYRKQQLTHQLIEEAIKYARTNGAGYIEAYPVDPESPSYRFMGFKPTFDKFGFEFRHRAGKRRNVMIRVCKDQDSSQT